MKQVILDVETQKTFDQVGGYFPEKLGISFVGVIVRDQEPEFFGESVKETRLELFEPDLVQLWPVLETADVVIGFNIDGFDIMTFKSYYPGDLSKIPTLDLMLRFKEVAGHRISLDSLAGETLGKSKTGDGLDAIAYYKDGQLDELAKYCMMDVEITRDLYDYGRIFRKVKYKNRWNEVSEIEVNFDFVSTPDPGLQMSLI